MKKYAVIVAGGSGTRMGAAVPKQFLLLRGKPVLYYAVKTFLQSFEDLQVILVLPEAYMERGKELADAYFERDRILFARGGDTRFQSVKKGLELVQEESVVFVHDAARCMLSAALIYRCYENALKTGSAVPVIACRDSIRLLTDEGHRALERTRVMLVQTPQVFHSKILLPAFQIDDKEYFTDEASVAEAYGIKVSLVPGDEANIKITNPQDLVLAEYFLSDNSNDR